MCVFPWSCYEQGALSTAQEPKERYQTTSCHEDGRTRTSRIGTCDIDLGNGLSEHEGYLSERVRTQVSWMSFHCAHLNYLCYTLWQSAEWRVLLSAVVGVTRGECK